MATIAIVGYLFEFLLIVLVVYLYTAYKDY